MPDDNKKTKAQLIVELRALRENEERYRALFHRSKDAIYLSTLDGWFIDVNDAALQLIGYDKAEIQNLSFASLLSEEQLPLALAAIEQLRVTGVQEDPREYTLRCKDGSVVAVETLASLICRDGKPYAVHGVARDLTHRRSIEEALRESEERFRLAYQCSHDLIYERDLQTGLARFFGDMDTPLGYAAGEYPLSMEGWGEHIHPDDLEQALTSVRESVLADKPFSVEYRLRCKDGTYTHWLDRGMAVRGEDGLPRKVVGAATNITERKKAEQALRESEERARSLMETAFEGICITEKGRIVEVNRALCRILGYSREEFLGREVKDFAAPEYADLVMARNLAGYAALYEHKLVKKCGEIIDVEAYGTPVLFMGRSCRGTAIRDITERKRAEQDRTAAHDYLANIVNAIGDPVFVKDEEHRFVLVNDSFCVITGYTREELLGKTDTGFFPAEQTAVFWEIDHQVIETGEENINEEVISDALMAEPRTVVTRKTRYVDPSGKRFIVGVSTDITIRKRAEDQVRNTAERIRRQNQVISALSTSALLRDGDVEAMSAQLTELVGATFAAGRVGVWLFDAAGTDLSCVDLYETTDKRHSPGMTFAEKQYRKEFETLKVFRAMAAHDALTDPRTAGYVEEYLRPLGIVSKLDASILVGGRTVGALCLEHVGAPHHWEPDEIAFTCQLADQIGIAVSNRDRRHAEEARQHLEAQVRHAQKLESLGVLAGGIAHDFNNILMAILGNAELALFELSEVSPARPGIEEIGKAARRAAELTRQMLAYSGKGHFEIRPVDLSEITGEMAHLLEVSISKKTILRMDLAKGLPAVSGDVAQLQQVIMNLIVNASESIDEDQGGVVVVRTGKEYCSQACLEQSRAPEKPPAGDYVYLEVSDTGQGMDGVTLERLFDPFFTTKFTGRGLGMSAVLGIMRGHGGGILVDSTPERGTTIRVLFPALDMIASAVPGISAGRATAEWKAGGTILVVDDEEALRKMLALLLGRSGFEVLTAADGLSAIGTFREHGAEIGCIILDLSMPHMDGLQTLHELRRIRGDVPIILSSGYSESELEERFRGEGVAAFLQKPFQFQALYDALQSVLGGETQSGDTP